MKRMSEFVNEILLRRKNKVILEIDKEMTAVSNSGLTSNMTDASNPSRTANNAAASTAAPSMTTVSNIDRNASKAAASSNAAAADSSAAPYIAAIMKNVEGLGYTFSWELYEALKRMERETLQKFYLELIPVLKKLVGADASYRPMYPNFPESVMEAEDAGLYINAIVHYWSFGTLLPNERKEERLPLFDVTKVKVIGLGSEEDLHDIFYALCRSKTSLSQTDKEDLEWIFKNLNVEFPEEIPLKENAALAGKLYLENAPLASAENLRGLFRTATDVLRLITAMSGGDISLAKNTKYRSFRRRERRLLMELLQCCGAVEEDMLRYGDRWIRVGERLHPGEFPRERFDRVITAFDKLRGGVKIETFASRVENAMETGDCRRALELLKKRPGELARRLDWLLRKAEDKNLVVNTFKGTADEVSTPVLLQVREHFLHRDSEGNSAIREGDMGKVRVFFPKGNLARCHCIQDTLPPIEEKYSQAIVKICENALIENYRKKEFLGNVYLSEEFKNYLVPFSQRSAGKALKTIVRGSRLPIAPSVNALRAFIWWTNMGNSKEQGRVDIDLSAAVYDESWNCLDYVAYTNLKALKFKACHSGDIVNGGPADGQGVSEFLDVDMNAVLQYGGRYVVYQVYSFTMQKFSDMPHAMFGWMGREDVGSGEIYEPRTVEQKMDLTSESTVCIPAIFDCAAREVIWCDMNLPLRYRIFSNGGNNLESNLSGVTAACYAMVHMQKPNLYDLIVLNVRARGLWTEEKENADVIFDVEEGITPFDTEIFMGEYI